MHQFRETLEIKFRNIFNVIIIKVKEFQLPFPVIGVRWNSNRNITEADIQCHDIWNWKYWNSVEIFTRTIHFSSTVCTRALWWATVRSFGQTYWKDEDQNSCSGQHFIFCFRRRLLQSIHATEAEKLKTNNSGIIRIRFSSIKEIFALSRNF